MRESGRDLAKIIRDADGRVEVGKCEVRIDFSGNYKFGTELEDPIVVKRNSEARKPPTYPGKLRPGMLTWKSVTVPELTGPVTFAERLNCAPILPSSPCPHQSTKIAAASYVKCAPRVKPSSEISGGIIVPAATAPRLKSACAEPSTSSETEAVNEDEVEGQLILVLNRFSEPEKLRGRFSDNVLLNAVEFSSATGESSVSGSGNGV